MRHDVGCGFVSQHKRVEGLHVYLTFTIHLSLIQVSRKLSHLRFPVWPALPDNAGALLITYLQSLAQCSGPQAGPWSSDPQSAGWWDVLYVWCWVLCTQAHGHSAPQSVWQQRTGAAGQGGSLMNGCLNSPPGLTPQHATDCLWESSLPPSLPTRQLSNAY